MLIPGVLVGVAVWFSEIPVDRDEAHGGLAVGLGGALSFLIALLYRMFSRRPKVPKCPQCGHIWEGDDDWMSWRYCPGCGLKIGDETGSQDKP